MLASGLHLPPKLLVGTAQREAVIEEWQKEAGVPQMEQLQGSSTM
jgi:hypothetical protein